MYKGILSQHSAVFRDRFTQPELLEQELIENCPVHRVSDVPQDFSRFLSMLLDSSRYESYVKTSLLLKYLQVFLG